MQFVHKQQKEAKVEIREVKEKDAGQLLQYIRDCARTSEHLLLSEGEVQYTLDEEISFVRSFTKNKKQLFLIALVDGEIAGNVSIDVSNCLKIKHVGNLGIAVRQQYRGKGIGRKLMDKAIDWARKSKHLEIVTLDVFENNKIAIGLYNNLGFEKIGYFPDYFKQFNGKYEGKVTMMLSVK